MTKRTAATGWLRANWRWLGLGLLLAGAAFFRVYRLATLPPGLSGGEAAVGLAALNLLHHGTIPGLTAATGFAPLWVGLQALSVQLFGHTVVALRLWPVIIGTLAVLAVWLWARDWFDGRVAWIAAILMTVTPWAVTLSRSAGPAIMVVMLAPLALWVGARAFTRGEARWWWSTAVVVLLALGSGPLGWALVATLLVLAIVAGWSKWRLFLKRSSVGPVVLITVGLVAAVVIAIVRWSDLKNLGHASALTAHVSTITTTVGKVAAMFNLHGDDSFLHNFNSEPMLNAFVGLMFIAGLLVSLTRLPQRRYLALLKAFAIGFIAAVVSPLGAPNDAHAALLLPVTLVLAAVGTGYMLELWYTTFPINSAARSTGLSAILLLMGLTVFQGYVQVFRAWSGSAETYLAYDEAAVASARYINSAKFTGSRIVVAVPDEQTVIAYLAYGKTYTPLAPVGLNALAPGTTPHQFIITANVRNEAARDLALKFAGGKLVPHDSSFSQNELFYTYETAQ